MSVTYFAALPLLSPFRSQQKSTVRQKSLSSLGSSFLRMCASFIAFLQMHCSKYSLISIPGSFCWRGRAAEHPASFSEQGLTGGVLTLSMLEFIWIYFSASLAGTNTRPLRSKPRFLSLFSSSSSNRSLSFAS